MADPAKAATDFKALLADILDDPELVRSKNITAEDILELQKCINPYAYVFTPKDKTKRALIVSYTNLRQGYLERFLTTGLVGFLFRMVREWEVPADKRRWLPKRKKGDVAAADTAPWSAADLRERAEALLELATIAEKADGAAAAAVALAASSEQKRKEAALLASDAGASEEVAKAAKFEEACADEALRVADAALSKSHGLRYSAHYELRKFGQDADARIDAVAAEARQYPEVREIIDLAPINRKDISQLEMPKAMAKGIITNFLRTWFEFDPDAHVRSAHDEVVIQEATGDVEVPGLPGTYPHDKADPDRLPLGVILADPPAFANAEDEAAFRAMTVSQRVYNASCCLLRNGQAAAGFRLATDDAARYERFRRYLLPVSKDSAARAAVTVVPPADTFHRFRYYVEHNYEELRSATAALYHDKPDLDWALLPYEVHEGETEEELDEQYDAFKQRHEDEVVSGIKSIEMMGKWALLGDFKKNRDKIEFYNKNTEVVKRILDQHTEDQKLGADLMRKRVRKLKAANIKRDGPDAPGLESYTSHHSGESARAHGAERVISREEMLKLERSKGDLKAARELEAIDEHTRAIHDLTEKGKLNALDHDDRRRLADAHKNLAVAKEMIEVPDDAIQVDVWENKGGKLTKSKFYTKAESPAELLKSQRDAQQQQQLMPHARVQLEAALKHERAALRLERAARVSESAAHAAELKGGGGAAKSD